MADPNNGFDPCECIWNHEMAMRRLINLLRSSQSYCNDNDCITDLPSLQGQPQNESNMYFMIMCWTVLAMALFFLRPRSLRTQDDSKPRDQGPDSRPPNPPAVN